MDRTRAQRETDLMRTASRLIDNIIHAELAIS